MLRLTGLTAPVDNGEESSWARVDVVSMSCNDED